MNSAWLLIDLTKRDLAARYASSAAGVVWLLLYPIIVCVIFITFFQLMNDRGDAAASGNPALFIMCGFAPFQFWSEALNRAPSAIVAVPHLVKAVVFPLEVVCGSVVLAACIQLVVNLLLVVIIGTLGLGAPLNWSILLVPIIIFPLVLIVFAITLILAALGVFLRDVVQIVSLLTMGSMFFGPVFYSRDVAGGILGFLLWINPLTQPIEDLRRIFIAGTAPDFSAVAIQFAVGVGAVFVAVKYFRSFREDFADVL